MTKFSNQISLRTAIFAFFFLLISLLGGAQIYISYEGSLERLQELSKTRLESVAEKVDNQLTWDYFLSARLLDEHDMRTSSVLPLFFAQLDISDRFGSQTQIILLDQDLNLMSSNHPPRELTPTAYPYGINISQFTRGELSLFARLLLLRPEIIQTGRADWQNARWQVHLHRMELGGNKHYWIGVAEPLSELLADVYAHMNWQLSTMLFTIVLAYTFAWWLAGRLACSLVTLMQQSQSMRRFQFDRSTSRVSSRLLEVNELGGSVYTLQSTLEHFMSLIRQLCKTRELAALTGELAAVIRKLYGGDGAILWLPDDEDATCYKSMVHQGSGNAKALRLSLSSGEEPTDKTFEDAAWRWFAEQNLSYKHAELITLKDRFGENMGCLCVYFSQAPQIDASVRALVESYLQFATLALEGQHMLQQRKALFSSLIEMVASAIDAKSKYTGGHCQRVPELTLALAQSACECKEGHLADFDLSDDEWEALHIAAWMHDCGKVTTPEAIVDKATKLETVHNRIHEIRTRFEVLKRDKQISALQRQLAGEAEADLRVWLLQEWQRLDDEFAFVAECNLGQQRIGIKEAARLDMIAGQRWWRTLDDTLGLSHEELARKSPAPLPAQEPLFADKPEHLIPHFGDYSKNKDLAIGVQRDIPTYKANRGECYNLKIAQGTLTNEDRFKINDHIVQTIQMLNQLPYPKHLKSVPDIAGAHHERLDGKGYPRQLAAADIPLTARILTIADIFEALTAADRPYKKAKTLDDALTIMQQMAQSGHIDPELFALFLRTGIYLDYAQVYLPPEQQDDVDVSQMVAAL